MFTVGINMYVCVCMCATVIELQFHMLSWEI